MLELLPHKQPMLFLTRAESVSETRGMSSVLVKHEHWPDGSGRVPAMVGIEYMAQTAALLGVSQRGASEGHGVLLSVRTSKSNRSTFVVGEELLVTVTIVASVGGTSIFEGEILQQADGKSCMTGTFLIHDPG